MSNRVAPLSAFNRLFKRIGTGLGNYVKRLASDYAAVAKDVAFDCRKQPLKAALVGASLLGLLYACKTNPGELVLRARLAECRQEMVLVPLQIHNRQTDNLLQKYTGLLNCNRLKFYNCWFFTLALQRPHDQRNNFFAAHDKTTRDWFWKDLWLDCLDIGAFGRFWILEYGMKNCDIREQEFDAIGGRPSEGKRKKMRRKAHNKNCDYDDYDNYHSVFSKD